MTYQLSEWHSHINNVETTCKYGPTELYGALVLPEVHHQRATQRKSPGTRSSALRVGPSRRTSLPDGPFAPFNKRPFAAERTPSSQRYQQFAQSIVRIRSEAPPMSRPPPIPTPGERCA